MLFWIASPVQTAFLGQPGMGKLQILLLLALLAWPADFNKASLKKEIDAAQHFLRKIVDNFNALTKQGVDKNKHALWQRYMNAFGKNYTEKEMKMRKRMFMKNKILVDQLNELYMKGKILYTSNLNQFSDRSAKELRKMNGYRAHEELPDLWRAPPKRIARQEDYWNYFHYSSDPVPDSIDWRLLRYVTPVMFQGLCGSCYAIAGIGALEAYHKRQTTELVKLSTQNILNCTWYLKNRGCDGGNIPSVFRYAQSTGVVSNFHYPYTMNASHNCQWKYGHAAATDKGYYVIPSANELTLQQAVAKHGPVAVAIDAKGLHHYRAGIFDVRECSSSEHAVLIVGYGTDPMHGDYWIVKNSWGFWWGEDGYVRTARNKNNVCNIAARPYFPY